jgi:hypothetical protein
MTDGAKYNSINGSSGFTVTNSPIMFLTAASASGRFQ